MEVTTTPAPRSVTLDATLAGPTSNSYVDMATAVAMAENIPGGGEWAVKDEETRSLSLIQATRWLETISYGGNRCQATQRLKWPRLGATCDGVTSDCADSVSDPGSGGDAGDPIRQGSKQLPWHGFKPKPTGWHLCESAAIG